MAPRRAGSPVQHPPRCPPLSPGRQPFRPPDSPDTSDAPPHVPDRRTLRHPEDPHAVSRTSTRGPRSLGSPQRPESSSPSPFVCLPAGYLTSTYWLKPVGWLKPVVRGNETNVKGLAQASS